MTGLDYSRGIRGNKYAVFREYPDDDGNVNYVLIGVTVISIIAVGAIVTVLIRRYKNKYMKLK